MERRAAYKQEFSFWTSANIGVEGFSKCHVAQDMDPYYGSKNEWVWLFGILLFVPLIARGRKDNEAGMHAQLGHATNRYSKLNLDRESSKLL